MSNKKIKVLVLGSTGMLGSMVGDYFSYKDEVLLAVTHRKNPPVNFNNESIEYFKFDAENNPSKGLDKIFQNFQPNYIINCIGIIKPWCKDDNPGGIERAVKVNSYFPYIISERSKKYVDNCSILQIATDCVFDGIDGFYNEKSSFSPNDAYGRTKSLGEVTHHNFLNIRTSIVGPEINNHLSLMDWFLTSDQNSNLVGYEHHKWNGITTLQFAELCYEIISEETFDYYRSKSHVIHYVKNEDVSKYKLLNIFKEIFNINQDIIKVYSPPPVVNRTLRSNLFKFETISMFKAIQELKYYMEVSRLFKNHIALKWKN